MHNIIGARSAGTRDGGDIFVDEDPRLAGRKGAVGSGVGRRGILGDCARSTKHHEVIPHGVPKGCGAAVKLQGFVSAATSHRETAGGGTFYVSVIETTAEGTMVYGLVDGVAVTDENTGKVELRHRHCVAPGERASEEIPLYLQSNRKEFESEEEWRDAVASGIERIEKCGYCGEPIPLA